jgi:hypothetical protein
MPKSYDDPDAADLARVERERVERARESTLRRSQQIREVNTREARRTHQEAEDTVPPPPADFSYPPVPIPEPAPGYAGGPSATIRVHRPTFFQRHEKGVTTLAKWIGALTVIGAPIWKATTWTIDRAKESVLQDARKSCVGIAASAAASAVAPYPHRIEMLEQRADGNDERWDGLDEWQESSAKESHRKVPPKFGPTAARRGDVRLWKK